LANTNGCEVKCRLACSCYRHLFSTWEYFMFEGACRSKVPLYDLYLYRRS